MAREDREYVALGAAKRNLGFSDESIEEMGFTEKGTWYRFTGNDGKKYFTVENDDGTEGENTSVKRIFVKYEDCARATGNPRFPAGTDCNIGKTKKGDEWYQFEDKKGRKCFTVLYKN